MHSHRVSLSDIVLQLSNLWASIAQDTKAGQDFQECQTDTDFTSDGGINSVEMFCGQIYILYLCLSLLPLRLAQLYSSDFLHSDWRASAKLT